MIPELIKQYFGNALLAGGMGFLASVAGMTVIDPRPDPYRGQQAIELETRLNSRIDAIEVEQKSKFAILDSEMRHVSERIDAEIEDLKAHCKYEAQLWVIEYIAKNVPPDKVSIPLTSVIKQAASNTERLNALDSLCRALQSDITDIRLDLHRWPHVPPMYPFRDPPPVPSPDSADPSVSDTRSQLAHQSR